LAWPASISIVNLHTYTGWGSVPYWNAFVANLEMQGSGRFYDPRLNDTNTFPVVARLGFANVQGTMDLITGKLPALQFYQLALTAPTPPQNSFDQMKAVRAEVRVRPFSPGVFLKIVAADVRRRTLASRIPKTSASSRRRLPAE